MCHRNCANSKDPERFSFCSFSGHTSLKCCKTPFLECSHGLRKAVLLEMQLKLKKEREGEKKFRASKEQILLLASVEKYVLSAHITNEHRTLGLI